MQNRIKGVENMMKKPHEEAVGWREKGVRLLEQIENFKTFKLKTPTEITESEKTTPVEEKLPTQEK